MNIINSGIKMISDIAEKSVNSDDFLTKLENLLGDKIKKVENKKPEN